jgi:hypothetical protein
MLRKCHIACASRSGRAGRACGNLNATEHRGKLTSFLGLRNAFASQVVNEVVEEFWQMVNELRRGNVPRGAKLGRLAERLQPSNQLLEMAPLVARREALRLAPLHSLASEESDKGGAIGNGFSVKCDAMRAKPTTHLEISNVLYRLDHVARFIVNANHSIM